MTNNLKRLLLILFKWTVLAGCIYYLVRCAAMVDLSSLKVTSVLWIIPAGCLYFLCTFLLAFAWRKLLFLRHDNAGPLPEVLDVYFSSALAKYLPSNVMHFAARHYLCKRFALSQKEVLLSNILEICLILASAFTLIGLFSVFGIVELPAFITADPALIRKLIIIFAGTILTAGMVIIFYQTKKLTTSGALLYRRMAIVFCLYTLFLILTGCVLFALTRTLWNIDASAEFLLQIIFCYICSWSLGFVTPGAPGGLGVREAVMVSLLGPLVGADHALIIAALFRLSTVLGEFMGYAFGKIINRTTHTDSDTVSDMDSAPSN